MDYWAEVMQDDVYLIAADGWVEAAKPRGIIEDKERKIKETPDLTIKRKKYKMDLIPPALIVARYFAKEQAAIEALQAEQETAARELEEFIEEHTGEEGLLEDATNDKGKVTKGGVKDRLKAIEDEPEGDEERDALDALPGADRCRVRGGQGRQGGPGRAGREGAGPIRQAHRGRDQDAGGRGQVACHHSRRH